MGANLSFSALLIDESSTNVRTHQEQLANTTKMYPDSDLYSMLEFEFNAAEARRNAAKDLYKIYLESEGKYEAVVNEAAAGTALAAVIGIIAAGVALFMKLFSKSSDNVDRSIRQLKAMTESLSKRNDSITSDNPHYNDEMQIRMPDIHSSGVSTFDMDMDFTIDHNARTAMIEMGHATDAAARKELIKKFSTDCDEALTRIKADLNKRVYGDAQRTTFVMIEDSGKAGDLYNKYISKKASNIISFKDQYDKFLVSSQKATKELEKKKMEIRSWGSTKTTTKEIEDDKDRLLNEYGKYAQELINLYAQYGRAVQRNIDQVAKIVLKFQQKFNRISDETWKKLLGLSEAGMEEVYGEDMDFHVVQEDADLLQLRPVNEAGLGLVAIIGSFIAAAVTLIVKLLKGSSDSPSPSEVRKETQETARNLMDSHHEPIKHDDEHYDDPCPVDSIPDPRYFTSLRDVHFHSQMFHVFRVDEFERYIDRCKIEKDSTEDVLGRGIGFKASTHLDLSELKKEKNAEYLETEKQILNAIRGGTTGDTFPTVDLSNMSAGDAYNKFVAKNDVRSALGDDTDKLEDAMLSIKKNLEKDKAKLTSKLKELENEDESVQKKGKAVVDFYVDINTKYLNLYTKAYKEANRILTQYARFVIRMIKKFNRLDMDLNISKSYKQIKKKYESGTLESELASLTTINEAGVGLVAVIASFVAAAVAVIIKLLKGNGDSPSPSAVRKETQEKANKLFGPHVEDKIETNNEHYKDECPVTSIPDPSFFKSISDIEIHNGIDAIFRPTEFKNYIQRCKAAEGDKSENSGNPYRDTSSYLDISELSKELHAEYDKVEEEVLSVIHGGSGDSFPTVDISSMSAGEAYNKFITDKHKVRFSLGVNTDKLEEAMMSIKNSLEREKKELTAELNKLDGYSDEVKAKAKSVVDLYTEIYTKYLNLYTKAYKESNKVLTEYARFVIKMIKKFNRFDLDGSFKQGRNYDKAAKGIKSEYSLIDTEFGGLFSVIDEESFIHGEPFDGDTLYDEEDYQDFNRTDWVNLGLGDHYKDLENQARIDEAAFKQECLYRVQPGFSIQKLQQLNEEVNNTTKKSWAKAMDTLKELIQKFIEKLYGAFGSNKPYLDRYKKLIIDGKTPATPIASTGDIFVGMYRILNMQIPVLNYSQMAADLQDPSTFCTKWCDPQIRKCASGGNWSKFKRRNDLDSIASQEGKSSWADFFKQYFGYGNDSFKNEWQFNNFTKEDFESIFNFLYDVKKTRDSIKKDQATIEDSIRRIETELKKAEKMQQAGNNNAQVNTSVNTDPKQADRQQQSSQPQQVEHSSAYSYVYGRIITEAEIGNDSHPAPQGGEVTSGAASNTTQGGYKDTNAAMKDINGTNPESTEAVRKGMTNYMTVARAILTAKMTALEFVRKELFQIIRYKVQFNERENAAGGQEQTVNNTAPQQQKQTTQPDNKPKK